MAGAAVTVDLRCSEPVTGLWCPVCLLPSAVQLTVTALCEKPLAVLGEWTVDYCPGCTPWPPRARRSG
jgi:hypothetical protein